MNELLKLDATVELQAAKEGRPPRVSILAYDGAVMTVAGFGPVVLDLSGMTLPDSLPLLADHDAKLSGIVGSAKPTAHAGKLIAAGTLSSATEAGQMILALHRDGVRFQASVGALPEKRRTIRAGETITVNGKSLSATGSGFTLIETSSLREISITAIGADAETSVSIAAKLYKETTMPEPTTTTNATTTTTAAELQRIEALCGGHWTDEMRPAVAELRVQAIAGQISIADLCTKTLELIRAARPSVKNFIGSTPVPGVSNVEMLASAFLLTTGHAATAEKAYGPRACNAANDLRVNSAFDLCRSALLLEGRTIPAGRDELIRAAFSTTSLPIAFGSSLEKSAMLAFQNTPGTWRLAGASKPVNNFREHRAIRPYHAGGRFEEVAKDGQINHSAPSEETFAHSAKTFAKMFSITRQDIINDDAGAVIELAAELGRQGLATISDQFWSLILSNPGSFFANGNGNLIADALDIEGLSAAIRKMREQTDADGGAVDIAPYGLIVPPALEGVALQALNSTEVNRDTSTADNLPSGNPWAKALQLGVEPRLSNTTFVGNSATAWYLTANPANVPAALVSFLNGKESPTIEQTETPANTMGLTWRGWIDVGVNIADHRAAVKSSGTA